MIDTDSALIVIDAQNQFVNDLPPEMNTDKILQNIKKVITEFRKSNQPVIYFREVHRKTLVDFGRELDGDESIHTIENTPAADYVPEICPGELEYEFVKRRYSCFFSTDLNILLHGLHVNKLYITGFLTDVCVHYTCADAHQYDYYVKVISDAVGGSSLEAHSAALNAINYLQHGSVIETKEVYSYEK